MEYITPGVNSNVNVVTKKFGELTECIDSGLDICKKLYSELPKCDIQRALLAIKRDLTAASSFSSSTEPTIGTANLAVLKAPPTPVIPSRKQPPTRKRGSPSSTVSAPPTTDEGEEPLSKRQKHSKTRVPSVAEGPDPDDYRQDTTLPQCMCYCRQSFNSKPELDQYVSTVHLVKEWLCGNPDCVKLYDDKSKLFKHVRVKHLFLLNYKCNKCHKTYEEWNSMRAHLDELHQIPAPDLRCANCNKLFYQKNKKVEHEQNWYQD